MSFNTIKVNDSDTGYVHSIFDISEYHSGATYEDLRAALAAVPLEKQKNGMSIKFIQNNKYVLFHLVSESFTTDTSFWVQSDTVAAFSNQLEADLDISDEKRNILVRFQNGHIKTKFFDSIKVGIETNNIDDIVLKRDLDISDENGNVLARFENGHIHTKNFDSSLISNNLKNKQLCIIGDSISTFKGYLPNKYGYYYPKSDVSTVDKCWWYQVSSYFKMITNNCSYTGSRVSGYSLEEGTIDSVTGRGACGCSNNRIAQVGRLGTNPDYILITLGTNDFNASRPIGSWDEKQAIPAEGTINEFSNAYALMLYKLQSTYKNAKIFCCTILAAQTGDIDHDPNFPCKNSNGESIDDFNKCIKRIAQIFCCEVIDLHCCGINYYNIQQFTFQSIDQWPNLHPNADGQALMAKKVIYELKKYN